MSTTVDVGNVVARFRFDTSQASKDLADAKGEFGGLGDVLGPLSSHLNLLTLSFAGLGAAAFQAGTTSESVFDTLGDRLNVSRARMEQLGASTLSLYRDMTQGASDVAAVVALIEQRTNLSGEAAESLARQYLVVADNMEDVADPAQLASMGLAMQNAWGMGGEALDRLVVAAKETGTPLSEMMQELQQNGAVLRAMGFSFDEGVAMMAGFGREGLNTSKVMMGLRTALRETGGSEEELGRTIRRIRELMAGDESDRALGMQLAQGLFGSRNFADMVDAIQRGALETGALEGKLRNAAGAAMSLRDTDFGPELTRTMHELQLAIMPIGEGLVALGKEALPLVTDAARIVGRTTDGLLAPFSKAGERMTAAAIGPAGVDAAQRASAMRAIQERAASADSAMKAAFQTDRYSEAMIRETWAQRANAEAAVAARAKKLAAIETKAAALRVTHDEIAATLREEETLNGLHSTRAAELAQLEKASAKKLASAETSAVKARASLDEAEASARATTAVAQQQLANEKLSATQAQAILREQRNAQAKLESAEKAQAAAGAENALSAARTTGAARTTVQAGATANLTREQGLQGTTAAGVAGETNRLAAAERNAAGAANEQAAASGRVTAAMRGQAAAANDAAAATQRAASAPKWYQWGGVGNIGQNMQTLMGGAAAIGMAIGVRATVVDALKQRDMATYAPINPNDTEPERNLSAARQDLYAASLAGARGPYGVPGLGNTAGDNQQRAMEVETAVITRARLRQAEAEAKARGEDLAPQRKAMLASAEAALAPYSSREWNQAIAAYERAYRDANPTQFPAIAKAGRPGAGGPPALSPELQRTRNQEEATLATRLVEIEAERGRLTEEQGRTGDHVRRRTIAGTLEQLAAEQQLVMFDLGLGPKPSYFDRGGARQVRRGALASIDAMAGLKDEDLRDAQSARQVDSDRARTALDIERQRLGTQATYGEMLARAGADAAKAREEERANHQRTLTQTDAALQRNMQARRALLTDEEALRLTYEAKALSEEKANAAALHARRLADIAAVAAVQDDTERQLLAERLARETSVTQAGLEARVAAIRAEGEARLKELGRAKALEDAYTAARVAREDRTIGQGERAAGTAATFVEGSTRAVGEMVGGPAGDILAARGQQQAQRIEYTVSQAREVRELDRRVAETLVSSARSTDVDVSTTERLTAYRSQIFTDIRRVSEESTRTGRRVEDVALALPEASRKVVLDVLALTQGAADKLEQLRAEYEQQGFEVKINIAKASFEAWKQNVKEDFGGLLFANDQFQRGVDEALKQAKPIVQLSMVGAPAVAPPPSAPAPRAAVPPAAGTPVRPVEASGQAEPTAAGRAVYPHSEREILTYNVPGPVPVVRYPGQPQETLPAMPAPSVAVRTLAEGPVANRKQVIISGDYPQRQGRDGSLRPLPPADFAAWGFAPATEAQQAAYARYREEAGGAGAPAQGPGPSAIWWQDLARGTVGTSMAARQSLAEYRTITRTEAGARQAAEPLAMRAGAGLEPGGGVLPVLQMDLVANAQTAEGVRQLHTDLEALRAKGVTLDMGLPPLEGAALTIAGPALTLAPAAATVHLPPEGPAELVPATPAAGTPPLDLVGMMAAEGARVRQQGGQFTDADRTLFPAVATAVAAGAQTVEQLQAALPEPALATARQFPGTDRPEGLADVLGTLLVSEQQRQQIPTGPTTLASVVGPFAAARPAVAEQLAAGTPIALPPPAAAPAAHAAPEGERYVRLPDGRYHALPTLSTAADLPSAAPLAAPETATGVGGQTAPAPGAGARMTSVAGADLLEWHRVALGAASGLAGAFAEARVPADFSLQPIATSLATGRAGAEGLLPGLGALSAAYPRLLLPGMALPAMDLAALPAFPTPGPTAVDVRVLVGVDGDGRITARADNDQVRVVVGQELDRRSWTDRAVGAGRR